MEATIGTRAEAACGSSEEEAGVVRQAWDCVTVCRMASLRAAVLGTSRG